MYALKDNSEVYVLFFLAMLVLFLLPLLATELCCFRTAVLKILLSFCRVAKSGKKGCCSCCHSERELWWSEQK